MVGLLLGSDVRAAILEEFTVQDWSGLALVDDQTGRLASCAIYSKYQNGATLFFIKHVDGGWALSLVHGSWNLAENTTYPLQYRVDRQPYVEDTGIALGSDQIGITFPDDDPAIAQIRRGTLLTVLFAGKEYGFELSNSGKALQAAKDCVERQRDMPPAIAERPDAPENPPEEASSPDLQAAEPPPAAGGLSSEMPDTSAQRQVFGNWIVAPSRDEAGRFLNCTAFALHGDDQLMLSHYPDELWDLSLYRPSWTLDTSRSYDLLYSIDSPAAGAGATRHSVDAVEPTRVSFEVPDPLTLLSRLERGSSLEIEVWTEAASPQRFRYPLDRASEAFAATRECTRRNAHGT